MQRCFDLNNFHALMEIVAGLSMTAIERLKKTWMVRYYNNNSSSIRSFRKLAGALTNTCDVREV